MTDEKKNMEEEVDVITLEFDDGVELECEIMGVFEHAGKEYIALSTAIKKSAMTNLNWLTSRMTLNLKLL